METQGRRGRSSTLLICYSLDCEVQKNMAIIYWFNYNDGYMMQFVCYIMHCELSCRDNGHMFPNAFMVLNILF